MSSEQPASMHAFIMQDFKRRLDTKHSGVFVTRKHANECLPQLDMSQPTPIQELAAKDLHGFEWRFKHIFERFLACPLLALFDSCL
ncbi:hypothetical protein Syun_015002 [Stephania yunnanensis]|uniref:Uncharacterized protein n=1 Tax=Stephania yunnanensis TaxID=152371 RepID=A0AAP0JKJ2_9MAGN